MLDRRQIDRTVSQEQRSRASDRRIAPRYAAGGTTVVLSWNKDDEHHTVGATLQDISLGGGSALAEEAPPVGSLVWFRLLGDDRTPWIGVNIIAVTRTGLLRLGPRLVRWRFRDPCPYQVFKSAIDGFSFEAATPQQTVADYNYRDWR